MFNGSYLRACMKLWIMQKLDFPFLSLGGPSIVLPVSRCIMFHGSFLRACMKLRIVQKIIFSLHESRRTKPQWPGLMARPSVPYFELSFFGCGFLIHLSNRSDSPRFRAPWKKIRPKYDIQQEPSLFKGHPLSCLYGDALCSMVHT